MSALDEPHADLRKWGRAIRHATYVLLAVAGLGFVLWLLITHLGDVTRWLEHADWKVAVVALFMLAISHVGAAAIFAEWTTTKEASAATSFRERLAIFLAAQIGKYVPGRIWSAYLQHGALRSWSMPAVAAINLDLTLLGVAVVGVTACFFALIAAGATILALLVMGSGAALSGVLLAGRPMMRIGWRVKRSMQAPRAGSIGSGPPLGWQMNTRLVFGLLGYMLGYGGGWLALMMAAGMGLSESSKATAILSFSYLAGVFTLLPAGIGSREAAMLALGKWLGTSGAVVATLAVVTRLAMVVVDLVSAGVGFAYLALQRRK